MAMSNVTASAVATSATGAKRFGPRMTCLPHRLTAQADQPDRTRPVVARRRQDRFEQSFGLARWRGVIEPRTKQRIELSIRAHATPPFGSGDTRSWASTAARSAWVARLSRDFMVPSGMAMTSAASASGRSRW